MALVSNTILTGEGEKPMYAKDDILIPNDEAGYGEILVARKGMRVPEVYRGRVKESQVQGHPLDVEPVDSGPDDRGSGDDLENMTKAQLTKLAEDAGFEMPKGLNKAEMVEALNEEGITGPAPAGV